MKNYKIILMLITLLTINYSYSSQHSIEMLVDANKLKSLGFIDGQSGTISTDLYGDGSIDIIKYTFSSSTPPGTCDQLDCSASLDESPILVFQIKMHNGKLINASYMCKSLGVSYKKHRGMRDIFCGPKYILKWNGQEYDIE